MVDMVRMIAEMVILDSSGHFWTEEGANANTKETAWLRSHFDHYHIAYTGFQEPDRSYVTTSFAPDAKPQRLKGPKTNEIIG